MSSSSSSSLMRIVCLVGTVSLLHCAYSAAQHRSYLRLVEQPFTQLPLDIIVQTLVSLIAVVYSASYVAGEFLIIRADIQNRNKTWDTVGNCPSFYTFSHRGKSLSPEYSIRQQQQWFDENHHQQEEDVDQPSTSGIRFEDDD